MIKLVRLIQPFNQEIIIDGWFNPLGDEGCEGWEIDTLKVYEIKRDHVGEGIELRREHPLFLMASTMVLQALMHDLDSDDFNTK